MFSNFRETIWPELKAMAKIGGPSGITMLSRLMIGFTDISFLGHLGTDELAASSLAMVWCTITTAFIYGGVCPALNTLCSQAIGAGNNPLVGKWLQVGFAAACMACVISAGLWLMSPIVLPLMGVSENVQTLSCTFTYISMIWIFPQAIFLLITNWLQAQKIVLPMMFVALAFVGVNFGLNWVFIYGWRGWGGWGFIGSPIATCVTRWLMLCFVLLFAFGVQKYHRPYWNGWSKESYRRHYVREYWKQVWPVALSSTVEELQFQVIALFAAHLGSVQLATHTAMLEFFLLLSTLMFGMVTATVVRTAYYLGKREKDAAKRVYQISICVAFLLSTATAAIIWIVKDHISSIFSNDPQVAEFAKQLAPVVGGSYVLLALFYTSFASLRGQGRPRAIAVAFMIGGWGVSVPMAYCFAYPLHFGLNGLWYGLVCGYFVITVILIASVLRTDWEAMCEAAIKRSTDAPKLIKGMDDDDIEGKPREHAVGSVEITRIDELEDDQFDEIVDANGERDSEKRPLLP